MYLRAVTAYSIVEEQIRFTRIFNSLNESHKLFVFWKELVNPEV